MGNVIGIGEGPSVEARVGKAAMFLGAAGIEASFDDTPLPDGTRSEGIRFLSQGCEIAMLFFASGKILEPDETEIARRQKAGGLVRKVIVPLQRAYRDVYNDEHRLNDNNGWAQADDVFNSLPGFH